MKREDIIKTPKVLEFMGRVQQRKEALCEI